MIAPSVIADFKAVHPNGEDYIVTTWDHKAIEAGAHMLAGIVDRREVFRRAYDLCPDSKKTLEKMIEKLNDPSVISGKPSKKTGRVPLENAAAYQPADLSWAEEAKKQGWT